MANRAFWTNFSQSDNSVDNRTPLEAARAFRSGEISLQQFQRNIVENLRAEDPSSDWNLSGLGVELQSITRIEVSDRIRLSSTNFTDTEAYVRYVLGQLENENIRGTTLASNELIDVLREGFPENVDFETRISIGAVELGEILFTIYRYNKDLVENTSAIDARRIRDNLDLAEAILAPDINGDGLKVLEGGEAFDFLLQKEQGILAALNEKIISERFSKLDTAQDNIIQISSDDTELFINRVQRRTDLREFFRIRSPYLSLIVPKIRLYKKVYIKEGNEYVLLEENNGRKEFKFKSFTSTNTIEDITASGFGRGDGIGIKDVSWEYEGTNPETVNSFINFNISLFFQNLSDLIPRGADDSVFRDIDDTSLIQLIGAGIGTEDARTTERETQTSTPFKFLIDAELGWTLSDQITEDLAADQSIDNIRNIIESTSINLNLSLREHNINFNEDGTLTLDLSYFSSIDQVFTDNSMNILALGRNTVIDDVNAAEEQDTAEAAAEAQAARADRISRMGSDGCTTGRINSATIRNTEEDETEEDEEPPSRRDRVLLEALRADRENNILNNYSTIFRGLLNGAFNGENDASKVYQVKIDASAVSLIVQNSFARTAADAAGGILPTLAGLADRAVRAVAPGGRTGNQQSDINEVAARERNLNNFRIFQEFLGIETIRTLNASQLEVRRINALTGQQGDVLGGGEEARDLEDTTRTRASEAETLQEAQQALSEADLRQALETRIMNDLSDDDEYTINFVRLGDIIDNIITGLKNEEGTFLNQQKDFFTFISGLYYYIDAIDGSRKAYNYCDMLISLNSFRSFFIEKVIRPLKTKYTLKQFVIDLVKEFSYVQSLVAVSEETYVRQESRPAFSVFQGPDYRLKEIASIQAAREELGEDSDSNFLTEKFSDVIRTTRRATIITELDFLNLRRGNPSNSTNYFVLKSTNFTVQSAGGVPDENEDINRGIYHITIGADKGILKSVNFRRDEIQGRREGRIVRAGALNFSALREKYDVTITTFGAPFFFPGMYFYLNPSMVGLGFPDQENSAAQILGIGGYYFINKVSNRISGDGNFETTIEASWNSYGDGEDIDGCPIPDLISIIPPNASGITELPIEALTPEEQGFQFRPPAPVASPPVTNDIQRVRERRQRAQEQGFDDFTAESIARTGRIL
jgi:hypothetical protein